MAAINGSRALRRVTDIRFRSRDYNHYAAEHKENLTFAVFRLPQR